MTGYVIIVDFRLKAGAQSAFRALIDANAISSAKNEQGCRRFDVIEPIGERDRVVLYEVYDDQAAFETHCTSAHFLSFDAESAPLVDDKEVVLAALVCEG